MEGGVPRRKKDYTPGEELPILKMHLLEKLQVSWICDQCGLEPATFQTWQKEFFEKGALVFEKHHTKLSE